MMVVLLFVGEKMTAMYVNLMCESLQMIASRGASKFTASPTPHKPLNSVGFYCMGGVGGL
jgi:hypothetical protein